MLNTSNTFDYFEEALDKGGWTPDGRFCLLGIKKDKNLDRYLALIYKEQTGNLTWQYIYETKNRRYIKKQQGEDVNLNFLVKRENLNAMQNVDQNIKEIQ